MKSVLTGIALIVVISAVAWFVAEEAEVPSNVAYTSADAVRLDGPDTVPSQIERGN